MIFTIEQLKYVSWIEILLEIPGLQPKFAASELMDFLIITRLVDLILIFENKSLNKYSMLVIFYLWAN